MIAADGIRRSPAHGPGVTEHLYVVRGNVRAGPDGQEKLIRQGRAHTWTSDRDHSYAAVDLDAEAVLTIATPPAAADPPA